MRDYDYIDNLIYFVCPKCKGEDIQRLCYICNGTGVLDWIEYARGGKGSGTEVSKIIDFIKHSVGQIIEQVKFECNDEITQNHLKHNISNLLEDSKVRRLIYDYKVQPGICPLSNIRDIDVYIKPNISMDIINLNFRIQ